LSLSYSPNSAKGVFSALSALPATKSSSQKASTASQPAENSVHLREKKTLKTAA